MCLKDLVRVPRGPVTLTLRALICTLTGVYEKGGGEERKEGLVLLGFGGAVWEGEGRREEGGEKTQRERKGREKRRFVGLCVYL